MCGIAVSSTFAAVAVAAAAAAAVVVVFVVVVVSHPGFYISSRINRTNNPLKYFNINMSLLLHARLSQKWHVKTFPLDHGARLPVLCALFKRSMLKTVAQINSGVNSTCLINRAYKPNLTRETDQDTKEKLLHLIRWGSP